MDVSTHIRQIGEATLAEFAGDLRGTLVRDGDAAYDDARSVWNAAHDRRPALVVRCAGTADVTRTVELARTEGVPLAVRGGGHSVAGFSTCDDGIVLDLSPMRGVHVDTAARKVTAQGGCTWRDVDVETQLFGLAVPGGLVSSTGIAGFTLGGGIGWLSRRYGLAADNLVAAEVVVADGQILQTDVDAHPELWWALRGGGGNFGVVTTFEFALHDIGTTVFAGAVVYPAKEAESVMRRYRDACADAPPELTTLLKLTTGPRLPFVPAQLRGRPVVMVVGCLTGESEIDATRPFRSLGTVQADAFATRPYLAWQQALDPLFPRGMHNYFSSVFLADLDGQAVRRAVAAFDQLPNDTTELLVHHLGGALGDVPSDGSAFATRDLPYLVNTIARTRTPGDFQSAVDWARAVTAGLCPAGPPYVNFTGEGSAQLTHAAYPPDTYRRLVAVKNDYDPGNLFRLNQNIQPFTT